MAKRLGLGCGQAFGSTVKGLGNRRVFGGVAECWGGHGQTPGAWPSAWGDAARRLGPWPSRPSMVHPSTAPLCYHLDHCVDGEVGPLLPRRTEREGHRLQAHPRRLGPEFTPELRPERPPSGEGFPASRWHRGDMRSAPDPNCALSREAARPRDIGQKRARRVDSRWPIKVVPRKPDPSLGVRAIARSRGRIFLWNTSARCPARRITGEGNR